MKEGEGVGGRETDRVRHGETGEGERWRKRERDAEMQGKWEGKGEQVCGRKRG